MPKRPRQLSRHSTESPTQRSSAALDGTPADAGQRPETRGEAAHHVRSRQGVRAAGTPLTGAVRARQPTARWPASRPHRRTSNRLCGLLNQAQEDDVKALQAGLKNALAQETSSDQCSTRWWPGRWPPPPQKARYYPLLAQAASKEAIDALLAADDREAAFAALLTVRKSRDGRRVVRPRPAESRVDRRGAMVALHGLRLGSPRNTPMRKYQLYRRGLEAEPLGQGAEQTAQSARQNPGIPGAGARREISWITPATAETAALVGEDRRRRRTPTLGGEIGRSSPEKGPGGLCRTGQIRRRRRLRRRRDQGTPGQTPRRRDTVPVSLEPEADGKPWSAIPTTRKAMKAKALAKAQHRGPAPRWPKNMDRRRRRPDRGR